MLKEEEEEGFALVERMHLSLNKFRSFLNQTKTIVGITLLLAGFGGLIAYDYYDAFDRYGYVEKSSEPCPPFGEQECYIFIPNSDNSELLHQLIGFSNYTINEFTFLVILVVAAQAVLGIRLVLGRKLQKELKELQSQFVKQSYFLNLEMTIPKGRTSVQKFFNLATAVFPELKQEKLKAVAEGEKLYSQAEKKVKKGEYDYDLVLETKDGKFILKIFSDVVKFEDIKELVSFIKNDFDGGRNVFRVISLAPKYDKIFESNELVDLMSKLKRTFNLDLIIEYDKGYSIIWID